MLSGLLVACADSDRTADVSRAQTSVDGRLGGRACTTLSKIRFTDAIEGRTDQFAKLGVLERQGALTVTRQVIQGVKVTDARTASGGGGTWEGQGPRYYCFGKWRVTSAVPSNEVEAPNGMEILKVTYELADAPDWVTSPEAAALARASVRGDLAYMAAQNSQGAMEPASYTASNTAFVAVPKP